MNRHMYHDPLTLFLWPFSAVASCLQTIDIVKVYSDDFIKGTGQH